MCVTAIIAGASLLMSAVGAVSAIRSANAQKDYAKWEAKQRTKELKENNELAKISALQRENERAREFGHTWSASLAAIGASGLGEHISFFQGIGPESFAALNDDIRAIRLGLTQDTARNHRQIQVVGYQSRVAAFNAMQDKVGAVASFVQDAMGAASFYKSMSTPKPA